MFIKYVFIKKKILSVFFYSLSTNFATPVHVPTKAGQKASLKQNEEWLDFKNGASGHPRGLHGYKAARRPRAEQGLRGYISSQVLSNIGGAAEINDGGQEGNRFAVGISINLDGHVLQQIILYDRVQYSISMFLKCTAS